VQGTSASTERRFLGAGTLTIDLPPAAEQINLLMVPSPDSVRASILEAVSGKVGATKSPHPLPDKIRRHWLVPVAQIVPLILLLLLILELMRSGVLDGGGIAVGIVLLAVIVVAVPYLLINWRDDTLEVTPQSLIRTRRRPDTRIERTEIPWHQVQGISASPERRLFGAGTLTIGFLPPAGKIGLAMIPSPPAARDLISTASASEAAQVGA
ncbi:MAG: hypothetical protein GWN58_35115, partial [Anaerolineae bacterium]|nr:hypothetical protein [Anaerolineae bacterium]